MRRCEKEQAARQTEEGSGVMTNEDLIARYYAGEDTRWQLYNRIRNLISSIARRVAVSYYCM